MRRAVPVLALLLLAACAGGQERAATPFCVDWARANSRLYGVHYSIADHLDDEAALSAWCMHNLEQR